MPLAYHYCDLESFTAIVESETFRLSNVFFMNDYMEVAWFKSICQRALKEEYDRITESEHRVEVRTSSSSSARVISGPYTQFCSSLQSSLSQNAFDHVYCGCFSKKADDLSQWRGYADDARGVCVGVDLDAVEESNNKATAMTQAVVEYDERKQLEEARSLILECAREIGKPQVDGFWAATKAAMVMRHLAPRFKNPAFASEEEVRLVAQVSQTGSGIDMTKYDAAMFENFPSGLDIIAKRGKLVPFVQIRFPKTAIQRVGLGPRFGGSIDRDSMKLYLSQQGVTAELYTSRASFRST